MDETTRKYQESFRDIKCVEQIKARCQEWEKKYNHLSDKLESRLQDLKYKKEKLDSVTINSTKKLKRRDVKISEQNDSLRISERELTLKSVECEKKTSQLEQMRKKKRNILLKVCRLESRSKSNDPSDKLMSEVEDLKRENSINECKFLEFKDIINSMDNDVIQTFNNGKYTNEIRETIMTFITEFGVSQKKNGVIEVVVKNLTGTSLSSLPSTGVKFRLLSETKRIAKLQVAEAMLKYAEINENDLKSNCLLQDCTSKCHRHFQSFQVTTTEKKTYYLGLCEVGSSDATSLMNTFKELMGQLSKALNNSGIDNSQKTVSKLVASIVSTMTEQGTTNPVFNRQLQEHKRKIACQISLRNETIGILTKDLH